jgi:NAD+ diphosphatase
MTDIAHYSGTAFERAGERRRDQAWIAARLADPETRLVPVWRGRSLIRDGAAVLLPAAESWHLVESAPSEPIFLGIDERHALFALDLSHLEEAQTGQLAGEAQFTELYGIAIQLMRREASLLSHAAWLVHWTQRHRFCGACGHPTRAEEAGHVRKCGNPACGVSHFPRTDPAVIVVVEHDDRCLLARQKGWPDRLHSCLAGFVEPGESAEEAVVREVKEESGVTVGAVRFHGTQPWPYPCSLMLGFYAEAEAAALDLGDDELAEAAWYSRAELADPEALGIRLPRHDSIARRLIDDWIAAGDQGTGLATSQRFAT